MLTRNKGQKRLRYRTANGRFAKQPSLEVPLCPVCRHFCLERKKGDQCDKKDNANGAPCPGVLE